MQAQLCSPTEKVQAAPPGEDDPAGARPAGVKGSEKLLEGDAGQAEMSCQDRRSPHTGGCMDETWGLLFRDTMEEQD